MKSYIQNGGDKRYQCSFCDASFTQNIRLLQHEVEHEPEVTHQCTMCDKVFKQRFACELHIRTNHDGSAPRILTNFHCKVCDKSFPDESECTDHMKNCRDKNEEIYDCAECGAVFSHQSWLDEHKGIHAKNRDFQCEMCNKIFVTEDNLQHHAQREHNTSIQCDKGDKSFIRKTSLVLHKRNHMMAERLRDPSLKLSLNYDMFKDRCPSLSDAGRHQCDTCSEWFTQKSSLSRHMLIHPTPPYDTEQAPEARPEARPEIGELTSGEENEQPSLLAIPLILERKDSKCFPRKKFWALNPRNYNRRQKGKSYQCDDCKKSFHRKSNLARHLQMNNAENHHKCGHCKKTFFTTMKYCKH